MTSFFTLLAAQSLDIRISAGLTAFAVGILMIALGYPLVVEAWQLVTKRI